MSPKTIWKFPLPMTGLPSIDMPGGAEILCVQTQGEQPAIWALVDPASPPRTRYFSVYGTGHSVDPAESVKSYVGTFQQARGALVFHVFEVRQ